MMHSLAKLKIQHTVNFTFRNAINCSTVFLKKGIIYLSQLNRHSKNDVRICTTHQFEFMVSGNKCILMTLGALKAHNTSTVTSCNGTSWINVGNLLF